MSLPKTIGQKKLLWQRAKDKKEEKSTRRFMGVAFVAVALCLVGVILLVRSNPNSAIPNAWRPDKATESPDTKMGPP